LSMRMIMVIIKWCSSFKTPIRHDVFLCLNQFCITICWQWLLQHHSKSSISGQWWIKGLDRYRDGWIMVNQRNLQGEWLNYRVKSCEINAIPWVHRTVDSVRWLHHPNPPWWAPYVIPVIQGE
jgi:hypothetical protein